jgi:hypothetical protein
MSWPFTLSVCYISANLLVILLTPWKRSSALDMMLYLMIIPLSLILFLTSDTIDHLLEPELGLLLYVLIWMTIIFVGLTLFTCNGSQLHCISSLLVFLSSLALSDWALSTSNHGSKLDEPYMIINFIIYNSFVSSFAYTWVNSVENHWSGQSLGGILLFWSLCIELYVASGSRPQGLGLLSAGVYAFSLINLIRFTTSSRSSWGSISVALLVLLIGLPIMLDIIVF